MSLLSAAKILIEASSINEGYDKAEETIENIDKMSVEINEVNDVLTDTFMGEIGCNYNQLMTKMEKDLSRAERNLRFMNAGVRWNLDSVIEVVSSAIARIGGKTDE